MLKLNRRIAAIKPSATLAADARATEMKLAGIDVISLGAGEPDFDTPERVKEAARKALAAGQTKYTAVGGTAALKNAIKLKLKRDNHLDYEPGEIIASAGCKQAEANVIAALFDEGDEVIIPTPAWVSFAAMVSLAGAEPKFVPCSEQSGFLLEPEALRRAITPRTRGIMLNSPSNPTGAVYGPEQLTAIARVLVDTDIWVMSDDVYEHIVYDGLAPHMFHLEPRLKSRGIVFNSLSKTYAMTGWRIGFAAGPKEAIAAAGRLQSQNSGNPNSITQAAAIEALTGPQDEIKPMLEAFRKRSGWWSSACGASRASSCPTYRRARFTFSPTYRSCSAAALATMKSSMATGSRLFCSTRRTFHWSAATTSARRITSGFRTPLRWRT